MSTSVATLRGNLTAFLLFATLAAMASQVVIQGLGFAELVSAPVDPSTIEPSLGLAARLFLTSSLLIVLYAFAAGAILFGAVRFLDNDPATYGDCVGMGLKRVPALVGLGMILALLAGLASSVLGVIGGAFMIVPMTILGVLAVSVLFVAAPVLVVEETGIIAAMRRSADLTKGARMTLLGRPGRDPVRQRRGERPGADRDLRRHLDRRGHHGRRRRRDHRLRHRDHGGRVPRTARTETRRRRHRGCFRLTRDFGLRRDTLSGQSPAAEQANWGLRSWNPLPSGGCSPERFRLFSETSPRSS
jgi:hypothetical protein